MTTFSRLFAGAFALAASVSCANAMDTATYKGLVKDSIQEILSGDIKDMPASLDRFQKEMQIGIEGCKEFAAKEPKYAPLMKLVVDSAEKMKSMKAEEIEEAWGDEGNAADKIGLPLKQLDQFATARNYLDAVVHPARAYAFFKDYSVTKDKQDLEEAKGELVEVLQHAAKIEAYVTAFN
jgi:hypothetical protein